MKNSGYNRRGILKQLGIAAGAAATGMPALASAEASALAENDDLGDYSVEKASIQTAEHEKRPLIAFTTIDDGQDVTLYLAKDVESESDKANEVEKVDSGLILYPTWIDDSTFAYWKNGTVFKRELQGKSLKSASVAPDATLSSLENGRLSPGFTTQGFSFSKCFSLPFVSEKVCISSSQFVKTRRDCYCGVCSGGQTPFMPTVSFSIQAFKAGDTTISAGGWVGVKPINNGFCYWSGDEWSKTCGHTCLGADAIPTPADLRDAFAPYLREINVDPNSVLATIFIIAAIALIGASPLPGPL